MRSPSGSIRSSASPDMIFATRDLMKRRLQPIHIPKRDAPVNEIVLQGSDIDLTSFPSPKFWPGDGGRYIGTGNITFTRDPDTGRINVGVYRQMLHGPAPRRALLLARQARPARPRRLVGARRTVRGRRAYGIDPVLFMVGAQVFGAEESELDVAGGIMGRPIELTEAEHVSLPIPAHAELVIEGLLHPGDTEMEGPLGEFTGYYGNVRGPQPVIEVKAVHHSRKSPILTAALMAIYPSCEIGAYYAIMRSARISTTCSASACPAWSPPIRIRPRRRAGAWSSVSMKQQYAGHAAQVLALTAQCPAAAYYTKWIIAVDEDVDPTDFNQVHVGAEHALQSDRRSRHPAQHLVDRARSEPVSAGGAALRLQGADQRLQAASPHQGLPTFDLAATKEFLPSGDHALVLVFVEAAPPP